MRTRRKQGGNVLVEFALASTVLVFLFLGTFQFGYSFYQYNSLVNAVRGAARYASMAKISNMGNGATPATYSDAVKNMVVYGSPTGGTKPIVYGLTTADVNVTVGYDAKFVPINVTVNVSQFTIDAVVKKFVINSKPSLKMPFTGSYCPTGC